MHINHTHINNINNKSEATLFVHFKIRVTFEIINNNPLFAPLTKNIWFNVYENAIYNYIPDLSPLYLYDIVSNKAWIMQSPFSSVKGTEDEPTLGYTVEYHLKLAKVDQNSEKWNPQLLKKVAKHLISISTTAPLADYLANYNIKNLKLSMVSTYESSAYLKKKKAP